MAEEFIQGGTGRFTPLIALSAPVGRHDTVFQYTDSNFSSGDVIEVGTAGMIDDEIVQVTAFAIGSITFKRGCADTTPAGHAAGAVCWFITDAIGSDRKEHGAGDDVAVKVAPFTTGGEMQPEDAPTLTVEMNWRFFRPYPPAQMRINGARWDDGAAVTEANPDMRLTWVPRDRILQADRLLGQDDPGIGPEPGTTYTMRVYDDQGSKLREEPGLIGTAFNYQWPQIVADFQYPSGVRAGYITFTSTRQEFDSWQWYTWPFTVDPDGTLTSQYMNFESGVIESPYRQNLVHAFDPAGNYLIGVAARPSDRMSDAVDLLIDGSIDSFARATYTPWLTSEYRLPELETTFNIRSSSLFDGVTIALSNVGKIAAIGHEMVQIAAIDDNTITLRRGCLDTVPQAHAPGARLWMIEQSSNVGSTPYQPGEALICKFRPGVYGPMIPAEDLPSIPHVIGARTLRPYSPGQIVINGRPWFEEATAANGSAVQFSWARRNRITQGTDIYDHGADDVPPEEGQMTRLEFIYTTPATEAGGTAVEHILRIVDVAGTSYAYPYDLALADGMTAGTATGVCGTVLVGVKIYGIRDGIISYQGYNVSLRLPSYPCAA